MHFTSEFYYLLFLLSRTCLQLITQLPCTYSNVSSWLKNENENIRNIIFPKKISCIQVNELLSKRSTQTKVGEYLLTTNMIDCTQFDRANVRQDSSSDRDAYLKTENTEATFYQLHSPVYFGNGDIIIQLKKDNAFLSPSFYFEERFGDLYTEGHVDERLQQCFYNGHVVGQNSSMVTMNICNGMQGAIRTSTSELLISPTHEYTKLHPEHYIYEADIKLPRRHQSSKISFPCPLSGNRAIRKIPHNLKFDYDTDGNLRLTDEKKRQRRALSVKRYIETMVVADESMFEYYGRKEDELRQYLLSIMAIVTTLMKDESIGNYVHVSVIKLIMLKKNPHTLNITKDASKSLKSFCEWQQSQNNHDDEHPEHFDTAILVTRKNLCSDNEKCETLGLAELGSICDSVRSCSVVEDNGLSVAFTIAHELGHLLNAPHDGEQNACNELNDQVHIMTPTFSIKYKTWTWSSCSRRYITEFIESSDAVCLLDQPSTNFNHKMPLKLPGEMFNRKQQCQLVYGKNSTDCLLVDKCDRLWCECYQNGRKSCKTNNMPWADGTACGKKKWCIQGQCRQKRKLEPIHGNWGSWSGFSKCSRPCGGGIKYATRECNNPRPSNNGDYCIGQRRKYKSCRSQPCLNSTVSFREQQCAAFNGENFDIPDAPKEVVWIPKYSGLSMEDSCKLFCEIKGSGIFYQLATKVIDGTKCRKGSNDICVDGKCRPAGCDNVLNSNAKVDQCGVCKGDNSACRIFTGTKANTSMGYNSVVQVPMGASRLRVVQTSANPGEHDTNFLAVLNHKHRYIFNGQWRISMGRLRYLTYGAEIYYSGPNAENETIWMPGPLNKPVEVKVLSIGPSDNVNIWYSYTFPISDKKQSYSWSLQSEWSGCFPQCNGHQVRDYECQRDIDGQSVSETKCSGKKPVARHRTCNFDCNLVWKSIKSQCSPLKVCGSGVQEQTSVCTKVYRFSDKKDEVLQYKDCRKAKIGDEPPAQIPCFVKCMSMYWKYSDWTKCNATCGGGLQERTAQCVDQLNNMLTSEINCNTTDKGDLVRRCNTQQCPKWHTGAWSGSCSVTCGRGTVERPVFCMVDDRTVDGNECRRQGKPRQTKLCKMAPCAIWATNEWSKCSERCGTGIQTRKVFCQTSTGYLVEETRCNAAEKPTASRKCFEKACELKAQLTKTSVGQESKILNVRWLTGDWGECSRSCGHGFRERVIACVSNNAIVTENYCDPSKKPIKRELCNTFSCPFWRHGAWSKCTKVCGNGTQTRLVLCGFNGAIVSNTKCAHELKPTERRFCNANYCPEVVAHDPPPVVRASASHWRVSPWSKCSTSCGPGHRTRTVRCSSHEECSSENRPESVTACNNGACPGWNYGQWTSCHTKNNCGKGWQIRLVVCQMENGRVLSNTGCDSRYKPPSNRTCELEPCRQDAQWTKTSWQKCNVPCGDGIQIRRVTCQNLQGSDVHESKCLKYERKPIIQKPCSRPMCPVWKKELWQKCDSSCIQHRHVYCVRGDEQVEATLCKLQNKPSTEQECSSVNCVREPVYTWRIGEWSKCGASCGYSLRAREVECLNDEHVVVDDSYCIERMPKMVAQCFEGPCPPEWVAMPWSECSASCGKGIKIRSVYCQGLIGAKLPDSACDITKKLNTTRECSFGSCNGAFRWVVGPWFECSRSCGIGETRRYVKCVDRQNKTIPDEFCLADVMPAFAKVCNTQKCPRESCHDVQRDFDIKFDGEHTLQVANGTLVVYCEGMHRNNPKEFISLKSDPKNNYAEIYGKRLRNGQSCPNLGHRQGHCPECINYSASGMTFFKKVRIDVKRMTIIPEDVTFADRYGRNPPGFASAGDCYSRAKCPQGRFMVNLKGTGLKVNKDVTWTLRGYHTSQTIERKEDGQIVEGTCGGYCGMCSPTNRNGLKVDLISR